MAFSIALETVNFHKLNWMFYLSTLIWEMSNQTVCCRWSPDWWGWLGASIKSKRVLWSLPFYIVLSPSALCLEVNRNWLCHLNTGHLETLQSDIIVENLSARNNSGQFIKRPSFFNVDIFSFTARHMKIERSKNLLPIKTHI